LNKSDYHKYLASREWALLKEKVKERSKGRCERCANMDYSHTHHLTYERLGREKLEDLQGVCAPCHEFLSAKSHSDPATIVTFIIAYPSGNIMGLSGSRQGTKISIIEHEFGDNPVIDSDGQVFVLDPRVYIFCTPNFCDEFHPDTNPPDWARMWLDENPDWTREKAIKNVNDRIEKGSIDDIRTLARDPLNG
jgi:hypothetical protein